MQTQIEELADNRVRLEVEVPREDVKHAVDHAASDLAQSLKIPGFRKGKVPMPVLVARVGRERLYSEAVESHIGGWFRNAAVRTGIRPVAAPEYGYELPTSSNQVFKFTATVAVQEKPELPDWTQLEVPWPEPNVPDEAIDEALDEVRTSVAELVPVEDRPAGEGDVLAIDFVSDGEARRDYVVELGAGRLVQPIEEALSGMSPGESKDVEYEAPDGSADTVEITLKDLHERVLPPLDDELARAGSEFDTLAELRADIEASFRSQLERESEETFRASVADALVKASDPEPSEQLVHTRATALLRALVESLERRGLPLDTYLALANQTQEQLEERILAEAWQSVARELVLEAAADRLQLEIPDGEVEELIHEEAASADEDPAEAIRVLRATGRFEQLRDDLRLRRALDRVAAEVKRISTDLAQARERLWTPDQEEEKTPRDTKLWTPGSKETR